MLVNLNMGEDSDVETTNTMVSISCVIENRDFTKKFTAFKEFEFIYVWNLFDSVEAGRTLATNLYELAAKITDRTVNSSYEAFDNQNYLDAINLKHTFHLYNKHAFRNIKNLFFPKDYDFSDFQELLEECIDKTIVRLREIARQSREDQKVELVEG